MKVAEKKLIDSIIDSLKKYTSSYYTENQEIVAIDESNIEEIAHTLKDTCIFEYVEEIMNEDDVLIEFANWYNKKYPEKYIHPTDIINYFKNKENENL